MRIEIVLLFLLMTLLGAGGSLLLKIGGKNLKISLSLFFNVALMCGGFLYFLSALLNIYLLKFIPYTIFLPLTAITYCWSMLLAKLYLKEVITWQKICGMILIISGISGLAIG
ncbi:MAG: multidrug transporter [Lentisphaerae bacterium]|nr:multidrug transporter [Lentisphaerota bacterium]